MQWQAWLAVGCGWVLASCGSSARTNTPAPSCEPGSSFCLERRVWRCGAAGEEPTLVESCSAEEECSENAGDAQCKATCFADRPTCDGDIATVCAADGSGPEPGGEDCNEDGGICEQGQCVEADCSPGATLCRNGDVYVCGMSGKDVALIDNCMNDEICDVVQGSCGLPTCQSGALGCDQTWVVECNEAGTGWTATVDCAEQGEVCFEGQCQEPNCPVGAWQCMSNGAYQCQDGIDWLLVQACVSNQNCVEGADQTSATCVNRQCVPDALVCHGNMLKTCTADGMLPTEGTDCGEEFCSGDACHPLICEVSQQICMDGDVYSCGSPGIDYMLTEECAEGMRCGSLADEPKCVADACTPAEAGCVGNVLGQCADDGQSLASVSEDCAAGSNVCDATGTCAATAVDPIGIPEDVTYLPGTLIAGNVIDVHSNRVVTELEANMLLNEPRDLRWAIAVWDGSQFEPLFAQITNSQQGSGYFSSGALSVGLEAGKRYVLGVGLVAGEENVYHDIPPWDGGASFGTALGGTQYTFNQVTGEYLEEKLYAIRVTTALP